MQAKTYEQVERSRAIFWVRNLIWIYFWLLIFEGALRKWTFQEWSAPLLVIRDPFLIATYFIAVKHGLFPWNKWVCILTLISTSAFVAGISAEDNTLYVALYGLRVNFLHFPLIFIMGSVFNYRDVEKFGQVILALTLPMALLMTLQFLSPPSSFINSTAGGEGLQITGTYGNIRPPGTFSFITGASEFLGLTSAFIIHGFVGGRYRKGLLEMASIGVVLALVVSISRLALSYVAIVVAIGMLSVLLMPKLFSKVIYLIFAFILISLAMLQWGPVQKAMLAFSDRIMLAQTVEGGHSGYLNRVVLDYVVAFDVMWDVPVFGVGLGMGTPAGSHLLYGTRSFALGEGDWSRIAMESGPILGAAFIAWRALFGVVLLMRSIKSLLNLNPLPLLLFGAFNQILIVGQISRPTTLGFAVLGAGFCLAAMRDHPMREKHG